MILHSKVPYQLFEIDGFKELYKVNCIREGAEAMHSDDVTVFKSKLIQKIWKFRYRDKKNLKYHGMALEWIHPFFCFILLSSSLYFFYFPLCIQITNFVFLFLKMKYNIRRLYHYEL